MSLFYTLNGLDLLLAVIFLITLGVGFAQGILRQVIGMAALYIALVLGAQYHLPLSNWIKDILALQRTALLNAISFLVLVVAVWIIVTAIVSDLYRSSNLSLNPLLDQLGGALLAVITLTVSLAFILPVIKLIVSEPWTGIENVRQVLNVALADSRLVPLIIGLRPLVIKSMTIWLPPNIPSILTFE